MAEYIALQHCKVQGLTLDQRGRPRLRVVQPGEVIPEASSWPGNALAREIQAGRIGVKGLSGVPPQAVPRAAAGSDPALRPEPEPAPRPARRRQAPDSETD